jgi:hypothetical protein
VCAHHRELQDTDCPLRHACQAPGADLQSNTGDHLARDLGAEIGEAGPGTTSGGGQMGSWVGQSGRPGRGSLRDPPCRLNKARPEVAYDRMVVLGHGVRCQMDHSPFADEASRNDKEKGQGKAEWNGRKTETTKVRRNKENRKKAQGRVCGTRATTAS